MPDRKELRPVPPLRRSVQRAKHNPPLAPAANGGLTRGSDFPICLPPDCFEITVRMPGMLGNRETQGYAPILKTSVHAELCSGDFQNGLVLLSIVSVFRLWGSSGVRAVTENALDSERRGNLGISWTYLAHGTHSFPVSILYNIFSCLSIVLCNFNIFTKFSSAQKCNLHKQPFTSPPAVLV